MKISYSWLSEFLHLSQKPDELAKILTDLGLEVEGISEYTEAGSNMEGLVVGKVLTCGKHPDADRLSITTVDAGDGRILNIVCGAPNVAAGQKVVVATEGTELIMGDKKFTIKKAKVRGVESEGMICAEDEIGLGSNHDGIMILREDAMPGTPAAEYFGIIKDTVFEIGLTPNRIDAASHMGTARDLAASFSLQKPVKIKRPYLTEITPDDESMPVKVEIHDTSGCRRFTGVTITGVTVAPSPRWMQNRLRAIGLSPINNVVDITNYVLHELGQPLHAYDADKLNDRKIIVRRTDEGTRFLTLDGIERLLSPEDVMVCDSREPVCIAGVFGGLHSGVSESTKNIFLESAYFDPVSVRKTARRYGLNTDSSFRFERGVDPQGTLIALKRAAALIKEYAGGKISSEIVDVHPNPVQPVKVDMLYSHIDRLIGKRIDRKIIRSVLESLDIVILGEKEDELTVQVPPYRIDVTREADVIEEILRIYGYNNIEFPNKLNISVSPIVKPENERWVNVVSTYLTNSGFVEIMNNSLTKKEYYQDLRTLTPDKLVPVLNPLSADLSVMRQTLLFGGLESIARNINHKNNNLRFFEFGRVYSLLNNDVATFANFVEHPVFALLITGNMEEQSWTLKETPASYFNLKAYYLNILRILGIDAGRLEVSEAGEHDLISGGQVYSFNNKAVMVTGPVKNKLLQLFEIEQEVYYAEIFWEEVLKLFNGERSFRELPKYPEVKRDLALMIDDNVSYEQLKRTASAAGGALLKRMDIFDVYKGKNIPEGKKSYAVSFFLQDLNKTLTDVEIDRIMGKISESLNRKLGAEIRK